MCRPGYACYALSSSFHPLSLPLFFMNKFSPRASPGGFPQGTCGMMPVQPHIQAGDQLLRSICKCQVVVSLAMMYLQVWPHCPHLHGEQNVWGQSVSRSEK